MRPCSAGGQGPFPASDAMDVMVQVLQALSYCHARRLLHRDLKPANVFIAKHRVVKLGKARCHPPSHPTKGDPPGIIHVSIVTSPTAMVVLPP